MDAFDGQQLLGRFSCELQFKDIVSCYSSRRWVGNYWGLGRGQYSIRVFVLEKICFGIGLLFGGLIGSFDP